MPTGVSPPYYPAQPEPVCPVQLDDSYFLVRLHEAQVFFHAGILTKPGYAIVSSSVDSTFQPGAPTRSLHQIATLHRDTPCRLGLNVNVSSWLPVRPSDSLKITLTYTIVRDAPLQSLVDKTGQLGLATQLSLIRPEWAAAIKLSQVAGNVLSSILQEGEHSTIFALDMDLNLANLKAGYYVVIGSHTDEYWPTRLQVDANGRLTDGSGLSLLRHSYAVVQVLVLKRRGPEAIRGESWGELLELGKERALAAMPGTDDDRNRVMSEWRTTVMLVRALARKDRAFLQNEVTDAIADAHYTVEQALLPPQTRQAAAARLYPDEWQEALDISTPQELRRRAHSYQEALMQSQELIDYYTAADQG